MRNMLTRLGFTAIASGVRLAPAKVLRDFNQWSTLVGLIKRLEINIFLDVGANRGFFSKHLRSSGYNGRLISFEPIPEDSRHITKLAVNDPNWTVCNYALGAESGNKNFQINLCDQQTVLSSFLPLKEKIGETKTVSVAVQRLDNVLPDLLKGIELPRIFLKMDTQGFDGLIIEGAGNYLEKIFGLQSEVSVVPLYDGMPHYTKSLETYERLGFGLVDLFVVNRTKEGRVMEYDCIMERCTAR